MSTKYQFLIFCTILNFFDCAAAVSESNQHPITQISLLDSSQIQYRKSTWIDFGFGSSSRDRAFTLSLNFELKKQLLLTFSYDNAYYPTTVKEVARAWSLGFIPFEYKPGFDTQAVSLKIGKIMKWDWGLFTGSAGISSVTATEYSRTNSIGNTSAIGLSLDIKLIPAVKFAGLALNPFLNINSVQTYGGITIGLALGQLIYVQ